MNRSQQIISLSEERGKFSYSDGKVQVNKGRIGSLAPQYVTREYLTALKKEIQNWLEEVDKELAKS